ncbi:MAG: HAMP domain-containing histidine kinase [Bacteroidales bacterium]|nr:HAMP domain-containing histidine kinase [Bacteroidales bacterium]
MHLRKKALIFFSTILGVAWVVLLIAQLHLMRRVFSNEKELFRAKLNEVVYQVFDAMDAMQDTPKCYAQTSIDSRTIDSLMSNALHRNMIFDAFEWGIYCPDEERFVTSSPNIDPASLLSAGFDYPLTAFKFPEDLHHDTLYVLFPNLERHYSWDIYTGMLLLAVLLAAVLLCFIFIIVLIIRESKVVRLRSNVTNHIIHELKTPITTISLTCQLLRDPTIEKDEETVNYYLSMIDGESKALQSLVEEVLTIFRSEKIPQRELHEISMHELLREVVDVHKLSLDECHAQVHLELEAQQDAILGDWIHLFNAVSNLVDNAIKYRKDDLMLRVATRNVGNRIEVRVEDNGIGIDEKDQKLIFEPFSRVNTDNANYVKGFGLGLSYVKFVVQYHHGNIKLESELGKGATFLLSLPLKM